jgi:hypothetical protein
VEVLAEIEFVADNIALITGSFLVTLIEITIVAISTLAIRFLVTIVRERCLTLVKFIPIIYM